MIIKENVPLSTLTTMRLGGPARYVFEVTELKDIPEAFNFAKDRSLPVWILGGGANTIATDAGFSGVVIINKIKGIEVISETSDEVVVRSMGGEVWDDFVEWTCSRGYSGVEALSKIPGSVGAAPVQNIGAYGQDISQVIESVEAYDTKTGELVVIGKEDMKMSYRSTIFNTGKDAGRYFIVAVTFVLENEEHLEPPFYNSLQSYLDEHNITDYSPMSIRKAVSAIRAEKLPDPATTPSSGSFFKNIYLSDEEAEDAKKKGIKVWEKPDGKKMINSGLLIEMAGLKGKILHGMKVSDKAALVLINDSASAYSDLTNAKNEIIDTVRKKYGFTLEQEPVIIPADGTDVFKEEHKK
ncbi:UDP-N-acetylmuramate dehydrogenase [Candidatus Saccharibacteria bacterium]|nr:UDP-N-acetylmuramate dehydrogenase [Candidatus Saccharibacteria bacterium]